MQAGKSLLDQELSDMKRYGVNPTLNRLQQEYRFISTSIDEKENRRRFLLQSLGFSIALRNIAKFCAVPKALMQ